MENLITWKLTLQRLIAFAASIFVSVIISKEMIVEMHERFGDQIPNFIVLKFIPIPPIPLFIMITFTSIFAGLYLFIRMVVGFFQRVIVFSIFGFVRILFEIFLVYAAIIGGFVALVKWNTNIALAFTLIFPIIYIFEIALVVLFFVGTVMAAREALTKNE